VGFHYIPVYIFLIIVHVYVFFKFGNHKELPKENFSNYDNEYNAKACMLCFIGGNIQSDINWALKLRHQNIREVLNFVQFSYISYILYLLTQPKVIMTCLVFGTEYNYVFALNLHELNPCVVYMYTT